MIFNFRLHVSCLILSFSLLTFNSYASGHKVIALVNDEAITIHDVEQRIDLFLTLSNIPLSEENRLNFRSMVLNDLINESLYLQDAKQKKITIDEREIEGYIANIDLQNNQEVGHFNKMIEVNNLSLSSFRNKVKSEIARMKITEKAIRPKLNITDIEIDEMYSHAYSSNKFDRDAIVNILSNRKYMLNSKKYLQELKQNNYIAILH